MCLPGREATVRGFSAVSLLIVHEAARVPDPLYMAVRPMLAMSGGRIALLSTPFGKRGFFHEEATSCGDDTRDRKSLGHADRKLAERHARELAKRIAELQHAGRVGAVTFGQLVGLYRQHRFPLLSTDRQRTIRGHLSLLESFVARDRVVDDLSQHDGDG